MRQTLYKTEDKRSIKEAFRSSWSKKRLVPNAEIDMVHQEATGLSHTPIHKEQKMENSGVVEDKSQALLEPPMTSTALLEAQAPPQSAHISHSKASSSQKAPDEGRRDSTESKDNSLFKDSEGAVKAMVAPPHFSWARDTKARSLSLSIGLEEEESDELDSREAERSLGRCLIPHVTSVRKEHEILESKKKINKEEIVSESAERSQLPTTVDRKCEDPEAKAINIAGLPEDETDIQHHETDENKLHPPDKRPPRGANSPEAKQPQPEESLSLSVATTRTRRQIWQWLRTLLDHCEVATSTYLTSVGFALTLLSPSIGTCLSKLAVSRIPDGYERLRWSCVSRFSATNDHR